MADGGVVVAGHLQQVCFDCFEAVVSGQVLVEAVEDVQAGAGAVDHGGGDGTVESDHGVVAGHAFQKLV
jgi:hypothetical protein